LIALTTEEKLTHAENQFAATGVCSMVGAYKILLAVCEHKYYVYRLIYICIYLLCTFISMYKLCMCMYIIYDCVGLKYIIYVYRQL